MDAIQTAHLAERIFWFVVFAGLIVLLFRLWRTGLSRTYRFFFAYLLVEVLHTVVLFFVPRETNLYGWVYIAFAPVRGVCAILVVLELYGLVLRGFRGIGTLGRWVVSGGMCLSFALALISLYPDLSNTEAAFPALLYLGAFQRGLDSALLLFLVLITAFLVWFPVPLSRNTVVHTVVFAVFFSGQAVLLLVRNILADHMETLYMISALYMGLYAICVLAWIFLLTKKGEKRTVVFGHRWRPGESDRLVGQLDALNATLLRSARK